MAKKWIWILLIVLLAAIIVIAVVQDREARAPEAQPLEIEDGGDGEGTLQASSTTSTTKTAPPSAPKLSYTKAIQLYGSKRVQFDKECRAIPTTMVVKNGTTVMFDNRSDRRRAIWVDGVKHNVAAYDFFILKLSYARLPRNVVVDCDSSKNNGLITVER